MKFTDDLWVSTGAGIYSAILKHPFLQGLTTGNLDEEAFQQYIHQDGLYLKTFGRGLALLAAKSETDNALGTFCDHARNALMVEKSLHQEFARHWTNQAILSESPPSPSCLAYSSFLLRIAYDRPWQEGLVAFLPCYWIYLKVGRELVEKGSPHPLYQQWISTYAGEAFEQVVGEMIAIVDQASQELTTAGRGRAHDVFRTACRYEYLFWDSAYRRECWPV